MKDLGSLGWGEGVFFGLWIVALVALQLNINFMNNAIE